jgi:hypothetical protein
MQDLDGTQRHKVSVFNDEFPRGLQDAMKLSECFWSVMHVVEDQIAEKRLLCGKADPPSTSATSLLNRRLPSSSFREKQLST